MRTSKSLRTGGSIVVLVILLPFVFAIVAYSINVAYLELVRTELQIATDLAVRASGRTLAMTGDQNSARLAANLLLDSNLVAGKRLPSAKVEFGVSTRYSESERYDYVSGGSPNAVYINSDSALAKIKPIFPTFGVPLEIRPIKSAICTQLELDIALVLDRSGSMAYADYESSRLAVPASAPDGWSFGDAAPPDSRWIDLCKSISQFVDILKLTSHDERVSLVTYNSQAKTDAKLTDDYTSIATFLEQYTQNFKGGATNVGGGILEGAKTLSDKATARPWATRVLIVLTDGNHNIGTDPVYAADSAANEKINVFSVTFSDEADTETMQTVATAGSGKHFHASNGSELAEAFEDIARSLPSIITY